MNAQALTFGAILIAIVVVVAVLATSIGGFVDGLSVDLGQIGGAR